MPQPIDWKGSNAILGPPDGWDEQQVSSLHVFRNGAVCVSCWSLNADEIAEIARTGRIFVSVFAGNTQPPILIGVEDDVRKVCADFGPVWPKGHGVPA